MPDKCDQSSQWLTPLVLEDGFSVEFRDDHVHVRLSKELEVNADKRSSIWERIGRICEEKGSRRVLVEGRVPEGVFQMSEVIDAGLKTATVPKLWMAFCFEGFTPDELSELYETVAGSRGVRVKFFSDSERALMWLRSNSPR